MSKMEDEFERFRDDLIAYLAARLHLTRDEVLAKLGDGLVGPSVAKTRAAGAYALRSRTHSNG